MTLIRTAFPRSLKGRFLAAYGTSTLVICLSLALLLWSGARRTLNAEFEQRGRALALVLAADGRQAIESGRVASLPAHTRSLLESEDVAYAIIQDAAGQVLAQAAAPGLDLRWIRSQLVARDWDAAGIRSLGLEAADGGKLVCFSTPVLSGSDTGGRIGAVRLGLSPARTEGEINRALAVSLGFGLGLSAVGFLGMFFLARWTLRPLTRMSLLARAIAEGDLSQRVPVESRDEVGTLAQAFGEMTESLARSRAELERSAAEKERLYLEAERSIRDLKEAQARLAYSEEARRLDRLRTVGQMASGIAHNFNNVMSAIIGRVQLLRFKSERGAVTPEEVMKSLEVVERAGLDGAETVRRLQDFSRGESTQAPVQTDLNELVRGVLEITRPRWKDQPEQTGIHIKVALDLGTLPNIAVVPSEIREILTNLIFNAVDAMPKGGDIRVQTRHEGERVRLIVEDTGAGMPQAVRERIFDPFYTTKGVRGTGLGLSTVFGIVKRHGGDIEVASEEGTGTRFSILLPVALPSAKLREEEGVMHHKPWRILVGDDEANVREVLVELLRLLGHEVREATGGREMLEYFRGERFDLVFTDLGMPDVGGWEVTAEIRKLDARVPVVLATGWGAQITATDAAARGVTRVLAKPYTIQKVSSLIAELQGMEMAA